jgi:uncharacterized protein YlzI (FlbEa/FlbD family)
MVMIKSIFIGTLCFFLCLNLFAKESEIENLFNVAIQNYFKELNDESINTDKRLKLYIRINSLLSNFVGANARMPLILDDYKKGAINVDHASLELIYSTYAGDIDILLVLQEKDKKNQSLYRKMIEHKYKCLIQAYPIGFKNNNKENFNIVFISGLIYKKMPKIVIDFVEKKIKTVSKERLLPLQVILFCNGKKKVLQKKTNEINDLINVFKSISGLREKEKIHKSKEIQKYAPKNNNKKQTLNDLFLEEQLTKPELGH